MRKVLPILVALLMAAPALADVNITAEDAGSGSSQLKIYYETTGSEVIRGIALKLTITDGTIEDVNDVVVDEAACNAYIDYYYSNPDYLTVDLSGDESNLPGGDAHPIANPDEAGALTPSSTSEFSISMGVLDNNGEQAGLSGGPTLLCTVQLTIPAPGPACVLIEEDMLRGGVVGDDVDTVNVPGTCVTVSALPENCFTEGGLIPGDALYDEWESVGSPDCWCYVRQCHGDADGIQQLHGKNNIPPNHWVGAPDLGILSAGFKLPNDDPGFSSFICADFNRTLEPHGKNNIPPDHRVGAPDLGILSAYFKLPDENVPADCIPGTLPGTPAE